MYTVEIIKRTKRGNRNPWAKVKRATISPKLFGRAWSDTNYRILAELGEKNGGRAKSFQSSHGQSDISLA